MRFFKFGKQLGSTIIAALLLVVIAMTSPSNALTVEQKAEFEALIRTYILENPEIIIEAQDALQRKQEVALKKKMRQTLKDKSALIFSSKNQFEIGNPKADIAVVEFFDYNCPFCKRAMGDMEKLLKEDKDLKFVMKELPILSEASVQAHRISFAAGKLYPEKYSEFHKKLLGGNGQKDGRRALKIAEEMGMDIKKIFALSKKEDINEAFREVNGLANDLGMNGTPSYVIGDEVIFGALGYNVLKEKIDNVRKCGSTVCS